MILNHTLGAYIVCKYLFRYCVILIELQIFFLLRVHSVNVTRCRILVQVTIYRRLLIGRDGHLDQSEAYDLSYENTGPV